MFYISKKYSDTEYAITDTFDNVTERHSVSQIKKFIKQGLIIYGVNKYKGSLIFNVVDLYSEKSFARNLVIRGELSESPGLIIIRDNKDYILTKVTKEYLFAHDNELAVPYGVTKLANGFDKEFNKDGFNLKETLIISKLVIPETVKVLQKGIFSNSKIGTVVLPETEIELEEKSFSACDIKSIRIHRKVILRKYCFEYSNLAEVTCRTNSVPDGCFSNCTNLSDVRLYNTEYIGISAFENCKSLSVLLLPTKIKLLNDIFKNEEFLSDFMKSSVQNSNSTVSSLNQRRSMYAGFNTTIYLPEDSNIQCIESTSSSRITTFLIPESSTITSSRMTLSNKDRVLYYSTKEGYILGSKLMYIHKCNQQENLYEEVVIGNKKKLQLNMAWLRSFTR